MATMNIYLPDLWWDYSFSKDLIQKVIMQNYLFLSRQGHNLSVCGNNIRFFQYSTNRLPILGDGFAMAMQGLDGGRINIATVGVGAAQQALNEVLAYVQQRQQFGKPIAAFQGLQFKLADMNTELVAACQMVRLATFKLDNKDADATTYCAMAKRFATDIGYQVCDEALQCFGGYGYMKEYPMERYLRDSRVHRILEGTNDIMRVIIARRMLATDAQPIL